MVAMAKQYSSNGLDVQFYVMCILPQLKRKNKHTQAKTKVLKRSKWNAQSPGSQSP
jgi:hypothetical protein